ncbi:hypothetical protein EVC45_39555 [Paraburkholderia sp. UYCP14C]|uniref:hypothetical protein n=1 Tax=Paraburkholderia sp. UYCP14C TaxID=2511130 RepID=UPI00102268BF|nr:hypothetical protein [Paraburkholderia sp. UYCP14C]RZF24271.1 hypothetical protein EVC45_39555 [Paraburkholderia sp. UYCP14C]
MKLRTVASCVSIALALAMPFSVINMARAFLDNGIARATLDIREGKVRGLSELEGDVHSLAPAQASTILSRHSLSSAGDLSNRIAVARADVALARSDYVRSTAGLQRALIIGFLCVAATSWAVLSLATVWPRARRAAAVTA